MSRGPSNLKQSKEGKAQLMEYIVYPKGYTCQNSLSFAHAAHFIAMISNTY
jgi:hypothetical protein